MSAMKRALKFGKSVSDNGWGNFIRILEEKCDQYGTALIRVDKWFPSSKTCLNCGYIHKELTINDREYICPACGHAIDRDYQAAINIDEEGMRLFFDAFQNPPKRRRRKSESNNRWNTGDRLSQLRGACETVA
jgi:putative transposase